MTNKTKLSAAALFSALVLGGTFATSTVFAAGQAGPDVTKDAAENSVNEVGHAYVTFTKDKPNTIHDPSDPGSTTTPSNPSDVTTETGELTLDAIPSSLNFGTQESTGAGQVVQLLASNATSATDSREKLDISKGKDGDGLATSDHTGSATSATDQVIFTQVTNVATTNPTWSLSATMTDFTNADNATLPGAFITFGGGANVLDQYDATTKTQKWVNATDNLATDQTLTAGGGSTAFVSSAQTGTFQQQWNVKDVTLTTPQAPAKGDYTSEIDWSLTAAPATQTATDPADTPTDSEGN